MVYSRCVVYPDILLEFIVPWYTQGVLCTPYPGVHSCLKSLQADHANAGRFSTLAHSHSFSGSKQFSDFEPDFQILTVETEI